MNWLGSCNNKILFFLILGMAFLLRFVFLADNPAGFFRDEADKGYTTYSLLQTGQDQAGKPYPLFVRSLQVTTSSLYQYLDMPFVATLGLTETAVRLPACLAGTASVLAAFFLARLWWGTGIALWTALFVTLSPWSLVLSRWANQSILLTLFVPLGVWCFALAITQSTRALLASALSAVFFLLALYTYAPARLVVPALVVLLWLVALPQAQAMPRWAFARLAAVFFVLFGMGSLPMLHHILFEQESVSRLASVSIFDGQPLGAALLEFLRNYLAHLSPGFLFLHGDANLRHNTLFVGQEHWFIAPLLAVGLWRALCQRGLADRVLLVWFICFPLAAACTRESIPHALRSVFAVPVIPLLAGYGLLACQDLSTQLRDRVSPGFLSTLRYGWLAALFLGASFFCYDYFFRYPVYAAPEWEYGYREGIQWWQQNRQPYEPTVISGFAEYPYIFFLFYGPIPPRDWIASQRIEGVTFIPLGQAVEPYYQRQDQRTFYFLRPFELSSVQPEKVVRVPSGDPIWKWVVLDARQTTHE